MTLNFIEVLKSSGNPTCHLLLTLSYSCIFPHIFMWFDSYVLYNNNPIFLAQHETDGPFNGQNVYYAVETKLFYITWIHVLTVGSLPQ